MLSLKMRAALRITMSVLLLTLLPLSTGCSWFGLVPTSKPVIGRPMTDGVDIVGVERGAAFVAPADGDLLSDSIYSRIMAARADGRGGEVYPVIRRDLFPLSRGDTIVAPVRGIFASRRWETIGMRFRVKK